MAGWPLLFYFERQGFIWTTQQQQPNWVNHSFGVTVHEIYHRKGEPIVRRRPSVQQLIEFCSCCRSAMKLRWVTAPECSDRNSVSCISFWNSALLCRASGGSEKKGVRLSTPALNVDMNGIGMSAKVIRVGLKEILWPNQTTMLK